MVIMEGFKKEFRRLRILTLPLAFLLLAPIQAEAGQIEVSSGVSFNQNKITDDYRTWNRRWGASVGYNLTDWGEIEIAFSDDLDRTTRTGEDITVHDQVYSANWVQSLTGKKFPLQPYFKVGIGQLNRSIVYALEGGNITVTKDEVTGVLGAGVRIYLTRTLAIRSEGTSYLVKGAISTWHDNLALTVGLSYYF